MTIGKLTETINDVRNKIYPFSTDADVSIENTNPLKMPDVLTIKEYVDEDTLVTVSKKLTIRI